MLKSAKLNIQFLGVFLLTVLLMSCSPTGNNIDESVYLQPENSSNILDIDFNQTGPSPHELEDLREPPKIKPPVIDPDILSPQVEEEQEGGSASEPEPEKPTEDSPPDKDDNNSVEEVPEDTNTDTNTGSDSDEEPDSDEDIEVGNAWGHCVENSIYSERVKNTYGPMQVQSFNLAITITGSFEGKDFWANLTNNFDDQGISAGLFQQNLGQGSLQPLLVIALERYPDLFAEHFSSSQEESLLSMLSDWKNSSESEKDRVKQGVEWALANLYKDKKGKTFHPEWKASFQSFLSSEKYIEIQEEAAMAKHQRVMRYMDKFNAVKLKTYLFFFDLVVQNGSTRGVTLTKEELGLPEDQRIIKLLGKRLKLVRPKYVEDVRARKMSILEGEGIVHKRRRDFSGETCISNWNNATIVTFN